MGCVGRRSGPRRAGHVSGIRWSGVLDDVHGPFDHVSFTFTDMPAMEAHLKANNIVYTTRILASGVRQINMKDPAGNGGSLRRAVKGQRSEISSQQRA